MTDCRNAFGWLVGLSYKAAKLIISHMVGFPKSSHIYYLPINGQKTWKENLLESQTQKSKPFHSNIK